MIYRVSQTIFDQCSLISIAVKFLLKGFVTERMGEREDMQDAHVVMDDFKPEFNGDVIPHDV